MGQFVIVCYKPLPDKAKDLLELVKNHIPVLRKEGLATERTPVVMRASDGSLVEVFEWESQKAIEMAHSNPTVLKMWEEFGKVCTCEPLVNLSESSELFPEFEPVNF